MSQILNSSRDFSTAIIDADCQLVAQGEGIPVHISALPVAGKAVKEYFGERIYDGDMFALNDPYFGGSHIPGHHGNPADLLRGQAAVLRREPGAPQRRGRGDARRVQPLGERDLPGGIRIPPLKLVEKGVPRDDVLQMLSANVRHPENFLGDFQAQFGSVRIAARRITNMLDRYGAEGLKALWTKSCTDGGAGESDDLLVARRGCTRENR